MDWVEEEILLKSEKNNVDKNKWTYYNDGSGDRFRCVSVPQELIDACHKVMIRKQEEQDKECKKISFLQRIFGSNNGTKDN